MESEALFSFLRKNPVFSILPDHELGEVVRAASLRSIRAGELVFAQGDAADNFYVVCEGRIRILKRIEPDKEISLNIMTRGDHFGETALITGDPRNASARAMTDCVLVCIDENSFQEILFAKPELREYFDKFIKHTSVHQFLRSCADLTAVPSGELQEIARQIQSEFFRQGEVVFRQGAKADKFYLIESGLVKVVSWDQKRQDIIGLLREGDFFGEKALLEGNDRSADIVCLTDCHLFSLTKEAFDQLLMTSPSLRKAIEDRIQSYRIEKPPIPYKEIIKQELAARKKIKVQTDVSKEEAKPRRGKTASVRKFSSLYRQHVRFPFISQQDEITCGTTCIMMIAKYHGKVFSSSRLRELAHVDLSGSSMANLASAAEQLGFSTRGIKLDYDTLMSVQLPCIVHWKGYHYIVVYRVDRKHVWVSDPALGLRKYERTFFTENWNGITLLLDPTPEFEKRVEDRSSLKNFVQFVVPHKAVLFEVFVASLLLNIFGLATPIFTQNIVDKVLIHHNTSLLNIMLTGMMIVLVFRILTTIIRQYLIIHTSMKIDLRMLVLFYKHLLDLPLRYFKVRRIGDFVARFGENERIRNFLTNTALTLILDSFLIVVYISLMIYYNVPMTVLVVLSIPVLLAVTLIFTPVLKRQNVDAFAARTESESQLIESIHAIETIKGMNIEHPTRWKWENKFIKSLNADFKLFNTGMYFHTIGDFLTTLSSTFVLWYGAHKVIDGIISVGELMAFMALMGSVTTPINRLIEAWNDIQETLVSVNRLNDVFNAKPEFPPVAEEGAGIVITEPRGDIVFENVYFRYGGENDPYILSNITLTIPEGKMTAIVGRSGSGKTTLVKLIGRLYDATEGKILIAGLDLRSIHLASLRRAIGFVTQESYIFNETIRENISLGDGEAKMEKVVEAAKNANADEFISDLTLGYETRIGESGLQLSGGQKQRIAIARVLYADPTILILDEATSSMDTESEQVIQKNLRGILKGKTAIVIAHRLSTVKSADHIVVLDNGEIVEQGGHETLMARQGLYHYLHHQQLNL